MKIPDTFQKWFEKSDGRKRGACENNILPVGLVGEEEMKSLLGSIEIYRGRAPWLGAGNRGLELAYGISSELARLTVTELDIKFGESEESAYLSERLKGFISRLRIYTEYACACGGVVFKPYYDGCGLSAECLLPGDFIPLETEGSGKIVSAAFISRLLHDGKYYTRVERHDKKNGGYVITNRAYASETSFCEGREVSLDSVTQWKDISPSVTIENLPCPLFAYFAMPLGNRFRASSPLGAPVFSRAEDLIRQADLQFGRLIWEFEGGELAVDASEDAFRIGRDGKPQIPSGKERLYRANTLDACCSTGELLKTFSPDLRDKSLINGLNRIIMFIEDSCGIARGTFSDPSSVARTATEVRSMRQKTYSTVCGIQSSLEAALIDFIAACDAVISLYSLAPSGKAELSVYFGDGVLNDSESDRSAEREDVKCGIITPEEFKERWY